MNKKIIFIKSFVEPSDHSHQAQLLIYVVQYKLSFILTTEVNEP